MVLPRVGVGVPNGGRHAGPEVIVAVAQAAEELRFDSVWTFERLMHPLADDGADLARARAVGVDEVIWDLTVFGLEPSRQLAALAALRAACPERSAA